MKLEVGSGEKYREGYLHLDIRRLPHVEYMCDARSLPFEDNSFEEVYSSHLIEHFCISDIKLIFKEVYRILIVGGLFEVRCPNFASLFSKYISGEWTMEYTSKHVFGGQNSEYDYHKSALDANLLIDLLNKSNFLFIKNVSSSVDELHLWSKKGD